MNKKILSSLSILLAVFILLFCVIYLLKPDISKRVNENKKIYTETEVDKEINKHNVEISEDDTNKKIQEQIAPLWKKFPYFTMSKEMKKYILNDCRKDKKINIISDALDMFPSQKEGFTSNPLKRIDESNLPNIYYVTMTKEDIEEQIYIILYRLSNIKFGNWNNIDYSNSEIYQSNYIDMLNDDSVINDSNVSIFPTEIEVKDNINKIIKVTDVNISDVIEIHYTNYAKNKQKNNITLKLSYHDNLVKIMEVKIENEK